MELTREPRRVVKRKPYNEMRKKVPQHRRFNRDSAADLICAQAKKMDMTRSEMARYCKISVQYVNKMLLTDTSTLKPKYIDLFAEALGMTESETKRVHHLAALEQGFKIGPYKPEKMRGKVEEEAE